MKKVALITIHGMGKIKPNYYEDIESALKQRLAESWDEIAFRPVQYQHILQGPQEELWQQMLAELSNDLDLIRLRQFLLYSFGDAGSLEYSAKTDGIKYCDIQREIRNGIDRVYDDFGGDTSRPIVVVANSLGCQVISNYLWDAQHDCYLFAEDQDCPENKKKFRQLESMTNLITTGCNMPLFSAGLSERRCFAKPNAEFVWDNYYDPDDILGWPLRQLGPTYEIVNDHAINAGGIISSWNPLSHTAYWSDNDVVKPLAEILKRKIEGEF